MWNPPQGVPAVNDSEEERKIIWPPKLLPKSKEQNNVKVEYVTL